MQVESFTTPFSFTPVSGIGADASPKTSSPVVESPSVPLRNSSGTEESNSFPAQDTAQLEQVSKRIQEAIQETNISLNFSRDEESGTIVIKLVDQLTGEAIQQIPSEAALRLAAALGKLQGQFFNQKA
jgi:flagellar protein FlaG